MRRNLTRMVTMFLLVFAFVVPVGTGAQDATPTGAQPALGGDLQAAVDWVLGQQLEDGAFAGFSGEADTGTTVDAVISLIAAQNSGANTGDSVDQALGYLASDGVAQGYVDNGVGQAAKLVLALVAAGEDPTDIGGVDPLAAVVDGQDSDSGVYGTGIYDHAYAMMALAANGSDVPETAITALETSQADNGGWAFDASTDDSAVDGNTTSMVVQALVATGNGDHSMVQGALEYLLTTLDDEGGAGYSMGAEADANSTALMAQAQIAVGNDASRSIASLQQFQLPSGAYFYQYADTSENLFSTLQVIPAIAGQALPIEPGDTGAPSASPVALTLEHAA
jgi:hypothetical protein